MTPEDESNTVPALDELKAALMAAGQDPSPARTRRWPILVAITVLIGAPAGWAIAQGVPSLTEDQQARQAVEDAREAPPTAPSAETEPCPEAAALLEKRGIPVDESGIDAVDCEAAVEGLRSGLR